MRILDQDKKQFLDQAVAAAQKATCERSKCGSVIVQGNEIIGVGYNTPPGESEDQRRCSCDKKSYDFKVTDKTCCMHAEQRAIMDALARNPKKLAGSILYFIRLKDGEPAYSGNPYCTICSKMALDVGVAEFVLWHVKGITAYDTQEYNALSYKFNQE